MTEDMTLADLLECWGLTPGDLGQFKPGAFYYPAMDWLIYLAEDVAYRSDSLVQGVVEVLWHPHEDRIVGMKIWDVSQHATGRRILKMGKFIEK